MPLFPPVMRAFLYQRLCWLTHRGFPNRDGADSSWRGGSRHGFSGEIARGLFGCGASGVGPAVEERQPEPAASVVGCGPGWMGRGLAAEVGGGQHPALAALVAC